MKYSVVLILLIIYLCSCDRNSDYKDSKHPPIIGFYFAISNYDGDDLLSTETQGTYNTDKVKLYYLIDGEKEEVFNSNNEYRRNFGIDSIDGRFFITIYPNSDENVEYPITYIEWNAQDTDTIKYEFDRGVNKVTTIYRIWYNDELVWNFVGDPFFEIVK